MKVMIVDGKAKSFKLLGRMDAQVGMISTLGNEIKSVNCDSCKVEVGGQLLRKTDVCIDRSEARQFGWVQPRNLNGRCKGKQHSK